MEIDKVFNGDVDGVADNLFSAVKNSVSEIKAMQQRKAAENVQLVIQALKKIESDLQDKFDGVTTVIEKRVSTLKDGRDGVNGRDGRDGKEGRPGKDGLPGRAGKDGLPGRDGVDGVDGVSVVDAHIDFDGSLIIGLSSGRSINVGEVVAPDLAEKIKVITNGGGTSQGVLDTLASLQSQITAISSLGAVNYRGTWNASTNTPTITAGTGTKGYYYVVSVAGSTSIDGQSLWGVGDWIIFNGSAWQKVDGGSTGDFTNLSASGAVTLSGGTANGVAYLNGSKVLTTGSALTFDGINTFQLVATGNAVANLEGSSTNNSIFRLKNSTTGNLSGIYANNQKQLVFEADGTTEQMRLTSTGLGIGTSSPAARLHVSGQTRIADSSNAANYILIGSGANSPRGGNSLTAQTSSLVFATETANPMIFVTNASEAMRLDSSGNLGLGVTPSAWRTSEYRAIQIGNGASFYGRVASGDQDKAGFSANAFFDQTDNRWEYIATDSASRYDQIGGGHFWFTAPSGTANAAITFTQALALDASGNLGLGVTPSAWRSFDKALQVNRVSLYDENGNSLYLGHNFFENSSGQYIYLNTDFASYYQQIDSQHRWYTAPSGTAGNAITFTQAMTLDASGNLGIGITSPTAKLHIYEPTAAATRIRVLANGGQQAALQLAGNGTTFGSTSFDVFQDGGSDAYVANRANASLQFWTNNTERARIDASGNLIQSAPTTPPSLGTNGQMVFNLTSNTNLRVSVRGSDGVTRTANITLS